jgi:predicted nucleic acid-binding protein
MSAIFVDTSGFYAILDGTDPYHAAALAAIGEAMAEARALHTTSYVVHEAWALIQHRLGWPAVDALVDRLVPLCKVEHVMQPLYALGAARCRQARQRHLSLTDCVSFEYMRSAGIRHAIACDPHFLREGIVLL